MGLRNILNWPHIEQSAEIEGEANIDKEKCASTLTKAETYDRLVGYAKVGETLSETINRIMNKLESTSRTK